MINRLELGFTTDLQTDLSVWGFVGCLVCGRITRQHVATGIRINDPAFQEFWRWCIVTDLNYILDIARCLRLKTHNRMSPSSGGNQRRRTYCGQPFRKYVTAVDASFPYEIETFPVPHDGQCPKFSYLTENTTKPLQRRGGQYCCGIVYQKNWDSDNGKNSKVSRKLIFKYANYTDLRNE